MLAYTSGSAEEMIANSEALITSYSSTIYVGLALGKEVYSVLDMDELRQLTLFRTVVLRAISLMSVVS